MNDLVYAVILAVHLLAANVAALGPFFAFAFEWRQSRLPDPAAAEPGKRLAWAALGATVLASVVGAVALGLLLAADESGRYERALMSVPSRGIWWGVPERLWSGLIEIVVFCLTLWGAILTWDLWRTAAPGKRWWGRIIQRGLMLFAGTNVLYHLPVLFAVLAVSSTRPDWQDGNVRFVVMMTDAEVVARVVHSTLGAIAVVGTLLCVPGVWGDDASERLAVRWGSVSAAAATSLNWVAGFVLLFQLPSLAQNRLLGWNTLETLVFVAALATALRLTLVQWRLACGERDRRTVFEALGCLALTIVLMCLIRQWARAAAWITLGSV